MPPGRPRKEKMEKGPSKQELEILQLAEAIQKLESSFAARMKQLEERLEKQVPIMLSDLSISTQSTTQEEAKVPVPFEWRQVVDEILSPAFGITVRYLDNANFELTLDVPKGYSNATPREWEANKKDHRVKVMPNYLGTAGVKDYCELVAKNLGQEIIQRLRQDKITHAQPA